MKWKTRKVKKYPCTKNIFICIFYFTCIIMDSKSTDKLLNAEKIYKKYLIYLKY